MLFYSNTVPALTSTKGLVIVISNFQSNVFHIFTVLSSDCDARYDPIGSHVTPWYKMRIYIVVSANSVHHLKFQLDR